MQNLLDPAILFFIFGVLAGTIKSNLEIPPAISRFLSLYLLMALGLKGGFALSDSGFNAEVGLSLAAAIVLAIIVPLMGFWLLKRFISGFDAAAIAATYGSVSAVTFVAAATFLEGQGLDFGGHMVAIMALMESPAIIIGVILMMRYDSEARSTGNLKDTIKHSFTNGSVLLILGSLVIGLIADTKQAEGIKPFTTDIFKGFLAVFLLDMGITSGRKLKAFFKTGYFSSLFATLIPHFTKQNVAQLLRAPNGKRLSGQPVDFLFQHFHLRGKFGRQARKGGAIDLYARTFHLREHRHQRAVYQFINAGRFFGAQPQFQMIPKPQCDIGVFCCVAGGIRQRHRCKANLAFASASDAFIRNAFMPEMRL